MLQHITDFARRSYTTLFGLSCNRLALCCASCNFLPSILPQQGPAICCPSCLVLPTYFCGVDRGSHSLKQLAVPGTSLAFIPGISATIFCLAALSASKLWQVDITPLTVVLLFAEASQPGTLSPVVAAICVLHPSPPWLPGVASASSCASIQDTVQVTLFGPWHPLYINARLSALLL